MSRSALTALVLRPRLRTAFALFLAVALSLATLTTASAGSWKGKKVEKDGVIHVMNPADPMESPLNIELTELWQLGGDSEDEDEFFGVITRIMVGDDETLYVLDNQLNEVKVYDADGVYLRSLGREGEGPGEFRGPVDMFFTPDGNIGVMQVAPGRIVKLTVDGDPAGDFPLPTDDSGAAPFLLGGRLMGDKLALAAMTNKLEEGSFTQTRFLAMVDQEGTEVSRLHAEARVFDFANTVIDEKVWDTFDRRWAIGDDQQLYACTNHSDYEVRVWNTAGEPHHVIEREFARLDRSDEEIARVKGIYEAFTRQVPNAKIEIGNQYKDVQTIHPRVDGSLWVMNSRGLHERPSGSLGSFDVFNKEGQFVREVTLMGKGDPNEDAYFFVGDRLYVVTGFLSAAMAAQGGGTDEADLDEEAEPMAVICYSLDAPDMGME